MQASLSNIVGAINTALWGYLLIYALIGVGLFFTVYLGAPQITKFGAAFKSVFGGLFAKKEKDAQSLSQFQALAVAISAQIGVCTLFASVCRVCGRLGYAGRIV